MEPVPTSLPAAPFFETDSTPLTILVVDDEEFNRALLNMLLSARGWNVIDAADGFEAVERFKQYHPDIVLMDVMMPGMDGFEATRKIKKLAGATHVPVIFVTTLNDSESLSRCLACGGDDFLSKPCNHVILYAKLAAHGRIRRLTSMLDARNRALKRHTDRIATEHAIAQRVFENFLAPGLSELPGFRVHLSPTSLFNGDIVQAVVTDRGHLKVLLGDFTGHGLAAAVGSIPVAEIFTSLSRRNVSVGKIAFELNARLRALLPEEMFFAAIIAEFNASGRRIEIWNGGMPPPYLITPSGNLGAVLKARNLALGIVSDYEFEETTDTLHVNPGDRLYLYSDGIIEETNRDGEAFGSQRLVHVLTQNDSIHGRFNRLIEAQRQFAARDSPNDDSTLVEVVCGTVWGDRAKSVAQIAQPFSFPWELTLPLNIEFLKTAQPVPFVASMLRNMEVDEQQVDIVSVVLVEMFSNSLEHGVLGLCSNHKDDEDGYIDYYKQRKMRLQDATEGFVNIKVRFTPHGRGGELRIDVQDSGPGFDIQLHQTPHPEGFRFHGLQLLQTICTEINYNRDTRTLAATYILEPMLETETVA